LGGFLQVFVFLTATIVTVISTQTNIKAANYGLPLFVHSLLTIHNSGAVREYINKQEKEDERIEQLKLIE